MVESIYLVNPWACPIYGFKLISSQFYNVGSVLMTNTFVMKNSDLS